ncbi:MAG: hypothetical protein ABJF23_15300 [Bryobacteraceae bacterium]
MPTQSPWTFKSHFRSKAYGWKGSNLAVGRLKEAVSEIKKVARTDAVTAADGAVTLFERFWPALQHIDTSSGAVGSAVNWAQHELLPLVASAPADRKTRDKWLDRLWKAIQEDGVDYLWLVQDHWGELCGSPTVASRWADQFLSVVRAAWSDKRPGSYATASSMCLSGLVAAERHQDLWDLLAIERVPFWPYRKFGVLVLLKEGRTEEALAYAEASRSRNQPDPAIDTACEKILLDAGRTDEAYKRYGLKANDSSTGLATFRAIAKKYPSVDRKRILQDLAESSGDSGRWFAATKDAGFYDLAIQFAQEGRTDPRTLSRAARDFVNNDAPFAMRAGCLAVERMAQGFGYEITTADVLEACGHFLKAAGECGRGKQAGADLHALASAAGSIFKDVLLRNSSERAARR